MDGKAFVARNHQALFSATALIGWALMDRFDASRAPAQEATALLLVA